MDFYIEGIGVLDYARGMVFTRRQIATLKHSDWIEGKKAGTYTGERTLEQLIEKQTELPVNLVIWLEKELSLRTQNALRTMIGINHVLYSASVGMSKIDLQLLEAELRDIMISSFAEINQDPDRERAKEEVDQRDEISQMFLDDLPKPLPQALQWFADNLVYSDVGICVLGGSPKCVFVDFTLYDDIDRPTRWLSLFHKLLVRSVEKVRGA